jgi:hypothetical protein
MYIILKQFMIGSDVAWVAKIDENDTIFQYDSEVDAQQKLNELNANETNGRKYRIVETN